MPQKLKNVEQSIQRAHKKRARGFKHFRATAVAVITQGSSMFMVYNKRSIQWAPVKGGVKERETIVDACIREVEEETGWLREHFSKIEYLGSKTSHGSRSGFNLSSVLGKNMHCVHFVLEKSAPQPILATEEGIVEGRFIKSKLEFCALEMGDRGNLWKRCGQLAGVCWLQVYRGPKCGDQRHRNRRM